MGIFLRQNYLQKYMGNLCVYSYFNHDLSMHSNINVSVYKFKCAHTKSVCVLIKITAFHSSQLRRGLNIHWLYTCEFCYFCHGGVLQVCRELSVTSFALSTITGSMQWQYCRQIVIPSTNVSTQSFATIISPLRRYPG